MTALVALGTMLLAYRHTRDSFHPLVIIAPMLAVLYGALPFKYYAILPNYFTEDQILFVQFINFLGVTSFCVGCLLATRNAKKLIRASEAVNINAATRKRLVGAAIILGSIGLAAYLRTIFTVGGFGAAYGQAYGGGWSDYGYVRDAIAWCVLAIILLLVAFTNHPLKNNQLVLVIGACCVLASPFIAQGFLGGRRGPTFLIASSIGLSWYMMRRQRPRLLVMITSGILLGTLLLFIVANRGSFYLGSDFQFENTPFSQLEVTDEGSGAAVGNEFVYGSGVILHADISNRFFWGKRFFAILFVRPIPHQLWENKYEDMGVGEIATNVGLGEDELQYTLGWRGELGAAPGVIADVWVEVWWFCLPVLFLFGWMYGYVWKRAVMGGVLPTMIYIMLASLSLFFIWQTFEALAGRFLFMAIPAWVVWKWANVKTRTVYSPQYMTLNSRRSVPRA